MIWEKHRHTSLKNVQVEHLSYIKEVINEYAHFARDKPENLNEHPISHEVPAELTAIYDAVREPSPWRYTMYNGELGSLWSYKYLCEKLQLKIDVDLEKKSDHLHKYFLANSTPNYEGGLFFGLSGILLFKFLLNPSPSIADELFTLTQQYAHLKSNELFWGESAYALCCLHMFEKSNQARWLDLYQDIVKSMINKLETIPGKDYKIWQQFLDGVYVYHLGAAHGYVGNVHAILASQHVLPEFKLRDQMFDNTIKLLNDTALESPGCCNWDQSIGEPRLNRTAKLVQWCHGAPGIVTSLAGYKKADESFEKTLVKASDMVWQAGPLDKSVGGICHGTAGNGYTFLFMYQRTGDEIWLERAKQFASAAIFSSQQTRQQVGQYKHKYWVGDLGTAVYVADCMLKNTGILTLDKVD
jgi:hypothetical protein